MTVRPANDPAASGALGARPPIAGSGGSLLVMPALAGFYFSFRAVIVLMAVRLFLLEPKTGAGASLVLGLVMGMAACFQSLGPAANSLRSLLKITCFRWVLAYLTLAGCSLAWSGAVSIAASFLYWCGVAMDVAIVVLLLRAGPIEQTAHSLIRGFIAGTCVLAVIAWVMPAQADMRLGDPEFFNTNQIGNACALAILLAQYLISRGDRRWAVTAMFLTVTVIRSLSKTTLVAFFLSEAFLMVSDRSMRLKTKLLLAVTTLLVGLSFWGLYESYYDLYTTTGNQAETFTGRTAIWAFALDAAISRPWLGNGFDSLWKVMPPFGPDQFEARHAENELLQQFFAYGAAGVVMLAGLYGSFIGAIRRSPEKATRTALLALMLFILVRGLAEAEPFDLLLPLWAITGLSASLWHGAPGESRHRQQPAPTRQARVVSLGQRQVRRPAL
jgi:exopolysaccharide production protein ExoQ